MISQPATSGIVLASASPRRLEMLQRFGIPLQVIASAIAEEQQPQEEAEAFVLRISREKAEDVARRRPEAGRWYIGCDTAVQCDTQLFGKPRDAAEASAMLQQLSGRWHRVLSAYALFDRLTGQCRQRCVITQVALRPLTAAEIAWYIASGEPTDKAGAYAIQGLGAFMVRAIEGSYTSVVGLPLCELLDDLQQLGAWQLFAPAP